MVTNRDEKNSNNRPMMEELTWDQARPDVMRVNPEFAKIIDELNPSKEYTLFKARYPYGSEILKRGDLYIPNAQKSLVKLTDSSIPLRIQELLGYNLNSNPATIVISNSVELYYSMRDHTIPFYGLISAGKIFGLWRMLNLKGTQQPKFLWDLSAGARSIFMLPKISETLKHNRLKKQLHVSIDSPQNLMEHWYVFKEIVNNTSFSKPWFTELLFFSKKWFDHLDDKKWINFNYELFRSAWAGSELQRNEFVWDLIFSLIQNYRGIKANPYIVDTVRHILTISISSAPGFSVAVDNSAAPIEELQKIYLDVYNLKNYAPIIMQPTMFEPANNLNLPVYYSLQFPTAMEFSPKSRNRSSIITDLHETKSLLQKYIFEISKGELNIESTPIHSIAGSLAYDYFHTDIENYYEIKPSKNIPEEDLSFKYSMNLYENNKHFPSNSTFVRGCIKISKKKNACD